MTAPRPYLLFPGTAREALERYQRIFGGELVMFTYAQFQRTDGPGDLIAHGMLSGPVDLYGSDASPDEDAVQLRGGHLALLGDADPATLHRWFDGLAEEGRVVDPLQRRPWGASDGQVIDAEGIPWLIGYEGDGPTDEAAGAA